MAPSEKRTIFVIDDEPTIRHICQTILEYNGYHVMTAADGVEAVAVYREYKSEISLVLLDLSLPRLSGREVFAKIRELNPDAKVIICSAYLAPSNSDYLNLEACAFLSKPFRPDKLLKEIGSAISSGAVAEYT